MKVDLLINENTGIIKKVKKMPYIKGTYPLHIFLAIRNEVKNIDDKIIIPKITNGTGFSISSEKKAYMAAIGEAIERYCCTITENKDIVYSSYESLKGNKLDLNKITRYEEWQYNLSNFPYNNISYTQKLFWVKVVDVAKSEKIWIPAELVFLPALSKKSALKIREPISTGLAAGRNKDEAFLSGLFECIERDASIMLWLKEISYPIIKNNTIDDMEIQSILKYCKSLNLKIKIFDITNNIPIPTYMVLIENEKHIPHISVGTNCHTNQLKALKGAIEEALGCYYFYLSLYRENRLPNPDFSNLKGIKSIQDHAYYYANGNGYKNLAFLNKGQYKDFNKDKYRELSKKEIIKLLTNDLGLSIFTSDLTSDDVLKTGLRVVRTVIPELCNLDCRYPLLKNERLKSVPPSLGLNFKKEGFNLSPHPFP
jgi:ribosomal protein S12 methylthiotransferase accessory factor